MSFIQSIYGKPISPLDLQPEQVDIRDVARALACEPRYSGRTRRGPLSVAQHSVMVSELCEPDDALWGLLHDASEAYLRDIPKPLKYDPRFAFYRDAEAQAMRVICDVFGLPHEMPGSVRAADARAAATERRDLMSPLAPGIWERTVAPHPGRIRDVWAWRLAEQIFLTRFYELTKEAA